MLQEKLKKKDCNVSILSKCNFFTDAINCYSYSTDVLTNAVSSCSPNTCTMYRHLWYCMLIKTWIFY